MSNMSGKLYVVATPIGNLGDMTPRAIEALRSCDIIAAEDTRTSMNLLNKFEIRTKMVSYHKFNERSTCDNLINELLDGKNIALISDAGTPCISDPGSVLVKRAVESNIIVEGIPGACAVTTALSISGFDTNEFRFMGFFPRDNGEIKRFIQKLRTPSVYIFYESPKRIIKTLTLLDENLENVNICLCNDLTKKFERIYRGTPKEIIEELRDNPSAEKGEYTVVLNTDVGDGVLDVPHDTSTIALSNNLSIEAILADIMIKHDCTLKAAVKIAAAEYNLNKNEVYAASLRLKSLLTRQQDTQ